MPVNGNILNIIILLQQSPWLLTHDTMKTNCCKQQLFFALLPLFREGSHAFTKYSEKLDRALQLLS